MTATNQCSHYKFIISNIMLQLANEVRSWQTKMMTMPI